MNGDPLHKEALLLQITHFVRSDISVELNSDRYPSKERPKEVFTSIYHFLNKNELRGEVGWKNHCQTV